MNNNAKPSVQQREAHPYAAVRLQVPIPFGKFLTPAWKKVDTWLAKQGITHGPAIIRYLTTDMSTKLDIEVGYVIEHILPGSKDVLTDVLPAGQYACLTHIGSYRGNGVYKANVIMIEWAEEHAIVWATEQKEGVNWWDSRVEWYFNDPAIDPDPKSYRTELTFKVVDEK